MSAAFHSGNDATTELHYSTSNDSVPHEIDGVLEAHTETVRHGPYIAET